MEPAGSSFLEFTAQTRMSGVDLPDGTKVRKGASDAIEQYVKENGGKVPADLHTHVERSPPWAARLWWCARTTRSWASFT